VDNDNQDLEQDTDGNSSAAQEAGILPTKQMHPDEIARHTPTPEPTPDEYIGAFATWLWLHKDQIPYTPWFHGSEHVVERFFKATGFIKPN
jgi:hypothetical protein